MEAPPFPVPVPCSPSGQTELNAASHSCGTFFFFLHWLWRFSPRLNHKKFWLRNKSTKDTRCVQDLKSDFFFFFPFLFYFLPLKLEPNVPLRGWKSEKVWRLWTMPTVCVRACVWASFTHSLGRKFCWGRVRWNFFFLDYRIGLMESRTRSSFFLKRGQKSVNVAKPVRLILRVTHSRWTVNLV